MTQVDLHASFVFDSRWSEEWRNRIVDRASYLRRQNGAEGHDPDSDLFAESVLDILNLGEMGDITWILGATSWAFGFQRSSRKVPNSWSNQI